MAAVAAAAAVAAVGSELPGAGVLQPVVSRVGMSAAAAAAAESASRSLRTRLRATPATTVKASAKKTTTAPKPKPKPKPTTTTTTTPKPAPKPVSAPSKSAPKPKASSPPPPPPKRVAVQSSSVNGSAGGLAGQSGAAAGGSGGSAGQSGAAAGGSGTTAGQSGAAAGGGKSVSAAAVLVKYPLSLSQPLYAFLSSDNTPARKLARTLVRLVIAAYPTRYTSAQLTQFAADPVRVANDNGVFKGQMPKMLAGGITANAVLTGHDVRNQGACASCWAHTAVTAFEGQLKRIGKYTRPISVQQLIDCVPPMKDLPGGCGGGSPMMAFDWLKTHAAAFADDYPLLGKKGTCRTNVSKGPMSLGWDLLSYTSYAPCTTGACSKQVKFEYSLFNDLPSRGPFIAYVDVSHWSTYAGGIFAGKCSTAAADGDHAVEIVGMGVDNGQAFWKIRNSWGSQWGENGFIRLPMGVNACGLLNFAIMAKVK